MIILKKNTLITQKVIWKQFKWLLKLTEINDEFSTLI